MKLTQFDMTDREMVSLVHDCVTDGDFADTIDMAMRLGADEEDVGTRRGIAMRLAYMQRTLKLVKRHAKESNKWKLTALGEELRNGTLSRSVEKSLDGMGEGDTLALTTEVTKRAIINGNLRSATMTRRIVNYGVASRRNGRRRR